MKFRAWKKFLREISNFELINFYWNIFKTTFNMISRKIINMWSIKVKCITRWTVIDIRRWVIIDVPQNYSTSLRPCNTFEEMGVDKVSRIIRSFNFLGFKIRDILLSGHYTHETIFDIGITLTTGLVIILKEKNSRKRARMFQ